MNSMSPESQRIAIAEAAGWKEVYAEVDWLPGELTGIYTWPHPTDPEKLKYYISRKPVPYYLEDLDAMHQAEKVLDPLGKDGSYEYWLRIVCYIPERESNKGRFFYRATAAQRAEAFLRTLNLWVE